jgi:hypothetical protein
MTELIANAHEALGQVEAKEGQYIDPGVMESVATAVLVVRRLAFGDQVVAADQPAVSHLSTALAGARQAVDEAGKLLAGCRPLEAERLNHELTSLATEVLRAVTYPVEVLLEQARPAMLLRTPELEESWHPLSEAREHLDRVESRLLTELAPVYAVTDALSRLVPPTKGEVTEVREVAREDVIRLLKDHRVESTFILGDDAIDGSSAKFYLIRFYGLLVQLGAVVGGRKVASMQDLEVRFEGEEWPGSGRYQFLRSSRFAYGEQELLILSRSSSE